MLVSSTTSPSSVRMESRARSITDILLDESLLSLSLSLSLLNPNNGRVKTLCPRPDLEAAACKTSQDCFGRTLSYTLIMSLEEDEDAVESAVALVSDGNVLKSILVVTNHAMARDDLRLK